MAVYAVHYFDPNWGHAAPHRYRRRESISMLVVLGTQWKSDKTGSMWKWEVVLHSFNTSLIYPIILVNSLGTFIAHNSAVLFIPIDNMRKLQQQKIKNSLGFETALNIKKKWNIWLKRSIPLIIFHKYQYINKFLLSIKRQWRHIQIFLKRHIKALLDPSLLLFFFSQLANKTIAKKKTNPFVVCVWASLTKSWTFPAFSIVANVRREKIFKFVFCLCVSNTMFKLVKKYIWFFFV